VRDQFWTPWQGFGLLDFDRMFRQMSDAFMRPFDEIGLSDREWRTPFSEMEYDKEKDEIRLVLEMPGIAKEDLQVHVSGKTVKVKGESENRKYMRSYSFPRELDPDKTQASFNNGILELTLGLRDEDDGRQIDIN
jgi:HSP20 family protein